MDFNKRELDDKIFRFICIVAMRDAVVQLSYVGEKKWLTENEMIKVLKRIVEPFVDDVLSNRFKSQKIYDNEFLRTTIKVCDIINAKANNNNFTFGNAQKYINIILKYLYIKSYKNDRVKDSFRFCHCPMDQQLLKNVWDNRGKINDYIRLGKRDFFLGSWGNEDYNVDANGNKTYPIRYLLFQQAVRELVANLNIFSLEYDYLIW